MASPSLGSLPVVELDCERSRHFAGAVADRLALAERRDGRWGMCSLVLTQKRRIYFLDYFMSSPHTPTSPRIYPYLPTSRHTSP